jgi:hypothetical protein
LFSFFSHCRRLRGGRAAPARAANHLAKSAKLLATSLLSFSVYKGRRSRRFLLFLFFVTVGYPLFDGEIRHHRTTSAQLGL